MRLFILGLVLGLVPVSVGAATVSNTYFVDREISFTDSSRGSIYASSPRSNTISVDAFDINLGTLTGVRLDYNLAFLLSVDAIDNPGTFNRAEIEADVIGQVVLRAGTSTTGLLIDSASRTLSVECGNTPFAIDSCDNDSVSGTVRVSKSGSVSFTPTEFDAEFGALPQMRAYSTLRVRLLDGEEATGFLDLMPSSGERFSVTVSYDYDAAQVSAVPLPAAGWTLLAALGMLSGLRRAVGTMRRQ